MLDLLDRRYGCAGLVLAAILFAHVLNVIAGRHPAIGMVGAIAMAFVALVLITKARGWTILVLFVFAVEIGHVVTRRTTFPFSNVGMYGWVEPVRASDRERAVLLDREGRVVPPRALNRSGLDALEAKVLAKVVRTHAHTHTHTHTQGIPWIPCCCNDMDMSGHGC